MMGSVLSNGFQFIVSGSQPKALNDFQIVNLQVNFSTVFVCYILSPAQSQMLIRMMIVVTIHVTAAKNAIFGVNEWIVD